MGATRQKRFYDFNVWSGHKRVEKLRYMHRNPVKRGLVESPELWRWSSFRASAFGEAGPVKVNEWQVLKMKIRPPAASHQPVSRELSVDPDCDHRWGFPCCCWSTLPACRRHYPGRSDGTRSLVLSHQRRPAHITRGEGSCVNRFEACSAFTSRYGLHARQVA
jgi:hypothetical protein